MLLLAQSLRYGHRIIRLLRLLHQLVRELLISVAFLHGVHSLKLLNNFCPELFLLSFGPLFADGYLPLLEQVNDGWLSVVQQHGQEADQLE